MSEEQEMYESGTYWDYEIAYRRERALDAAGHRPRNGRRPWATRPVRRRKR